MRLARTPLAGGLTEDARIYWDWAAFIVSHDLWGRNPFFLGPLYPYALAPLRAVLGDSTTPVLVVQALWGSAAAALLADAARRLTRPAIGLAVGLIVALYEMAVFFDGLVLMESLLFFLESLLLWLIVSVAWPRTRLATYAAVGLLIGLLAEGRATSALLLLAAAPCLVLEKHGSPSLILRRAGALLAGFALVVAPVAARNRLVGGEWIPFTYNLGYNLYVGNSPEANGTFVSVTGTHFVGEALRSGEDGGVESDGRAYLRAAEGLSLTPAASSALWTGRALRFMRDHPARTSRLAARKAAMMWNRREYAQIENADEYRELAGPLGLPLFGSFGFLGPLALAGLAFARHRGAPGRFLIGYTLVVTLAVVPFFVTDRYRHHLVPCAALLAAVAMAHALEVIRRPRWRDSLPLAAAVAAGLAVTSLPAPGLSDSKYAWGVAVDLGTRWAERGRPDLAVREYEKAIAMEARGGVGRVPGSAAAMERADLDYNYANALSRLGRPSEAMRWYERAVAEAPDHALAIRALADAYRSAGRAVEAESLYRVLETKAGGAELALVARGWAAARAGRWDEAERLFDDAVRENPAAYAAWGALVRVQVQTGRLPEAHRSLERARAANLPPADTHAYAALLAVITGDRARAEAELARVSESAPASDPTLGEVVRIVRQRLGRDR
jgi:tetratricopeptide (TPR) repeat protein